MRRKIFIWFFITTVFSLGVEASLQRKSQKTCDEYSKNFPVVLESPLAGGKFPVLGEFPHIAALGFYFEDEQQYHFYCGGSLISDRYILTVAYYIIKEQNELKIARLGAVSVPTKIDKPNPEFDYNVINVTVHKDIALVKLEKKVSFTDYVRPACLYTREDESFRMLKLTWKVDYFDDKTEKLERSLVSSIPLQQCINIYHRRVKLNLTKNQFCAFVVDNDDPNSECLGVSGLPVEIAYDNSSLGVIVGLNPYGFGCGRFFPGVYTKISSYLDWIEGIVWP